MKIAVLSDIHGNCIALDCVLADIDVRAVDRIVCLGDVVQGGAQPSESLARVRTLGCPVVLGNADDWLLTGGADGGEPVSDQQLEVREWSLQQLTASDVEFIRRFRPVVAVALGTERELLCFHGSPASYDDIILPETPEETVQGLLSDNLPAVLTGGHTHLQQIRRVGESFFFNPGSVGVAYDRRLPPDRFRLDPWAEYAVISAEDDCIGLEFRRVPLDVASMVAAMLSSGRPYAAEAAAEYDLE